jgi:hypothetical protein
LRKDQVFFELTKQEKISRIVALGCTHYVDDLPEILDMLPDGMQKILFSQDANPPKDPDWELMTTWQNLPKILNLQ